MSGVLHILYNKTVSFTIRSAQGRVWGFVFGIMCKFKCKNWKNYCKRKTEFGIDLKVTIVRGNLYYTTL
jgi:hypothetical protein